MHTAQEWIALAVRMQRRANMAELLDEPKRVLSYCRRRDYAAKKAKELGAGDVWGPISNEAGRVVA